MLRQTVCLFTRQKNKYLKDYKIGSNDFINLYKKRAGSRNHLRCVINVTHEKSYNESCEVGIKN